MTDLKENAQGLVDDAKDELQKKLDEANAKLKDAQKQAKGFVKEYRYFFIAGAFVLGFLVGLIF